VALPSRYVLLIVNKHATKLYVGCMPAAFPEVVGGCGLGCCSAGFCTPITASQTDTPLSTAATDSCSGAGAGHLPVRIRQSRCPHAKLWDARAICTQRSRVAR
jgi:hypothetical protein